MAETRQASAGGAEEQEPPPGIAAESGTGIAPAAPAPVVPPAVADGPIDLATALGLAGVDNPTIAIAAEAVRASQAQLLEARALLLPTLEAGASADVHDGNLLSARGIVRDINRESVYVGAGASAVGAGTVTIPGARITAQLADAIFEPQVARQRVAARTFDAAATRNNVLLDVTTAYFELAGAEASLAAVRQSLGEFGEIARLTANFVQAGQGRQGDAERAGDQLLLVTAQEQRTEEAVAVASAELSRLLSGDPAVRLHTSGGPLPLVQLVDPRLDLEALVQLAVRNRPEVAARSADVGLFAARLRQEKVRPFVPFVSVGYSAGTFGGGGTGTHPRFGNFDGRTDFDALAVWRLDNMGFGNLAVQRRVRAKLGEAEAERLRVIDEVAREVAESLAQSEAARLQVEAAARRARAAAESYRLDLRTAKNVVGRARPIEVISSATMLNAARQDLVRAVVGYDEAQFRLFVALGRPPTLALATPCGPDP
jgi:outer membrane protein TolC